jgi:hypothetical protein
MSEGKWCGVLWGLCSPFYRCRGDTREVATGGNGLNAIDGRGGVKEDFL